MIEARYVINVIRWNYGDIWKVIPSHPLKTDPRLDIPFMNDFLYDCNNFIDPEHKNFETTIEIKEYYIIK